MKLQLAVSSLLICTGFALASLPANGTARASPKPTPTPESTDKGKRNVRPVSKSLTDEHISRSPADVIAGAPAYFYEFTRPGFSYSPVLIEHDDDGRGKITFLKDGSEEQITDPIALSPVTMGKIKHTLSALDFLNSNENYQYERDFSNLGDVTFSVRKDGRERTVKYNWTTNKNAKDLMDEYRRITNKYTWLFEFNVARENQPLRTPAMMEGFSGFLRRNDLPDPPHLVPYLTAVSVDERLPLITRNHALKLIQQIKKSG